MLPKEALKQYWECIYPKRIEYRKKVREALSILSPGFTTGNLSLPIELEVSLLNHTLFLCNLTQKLKRKQLALDALAIWNLTEGDIAGSTIQFGQKKWVNIDSQLCLNLEELDKSFDTTCFVITDRALQEGIKVFDNCYLTECWQLLEKTGLFFFVETATAVLINLQYRDMSDSMTGYTLRPFTATVYTDWTDAPLRHAESIIHEAAHSWLNMHLQAWSVVPVRSGKTYWSPWRALQRPPLGIVHGTWAFSIVYQFYKRLFDNSGFGLLSNKQLAYCKNRLEYEHYRLQEVAEYISLALDDLGSMPLKRMISWYFPSKSYCLPDKIA